MVNLKRIRTPSKITRALKGAFLKKKLKSLLLLRIKFENGQIEKFEVPSKWKTAKPQLIEEAFGKCVFCECEIPSHQHGDVEHYRPKSIYWWLAYTIDNYLLSCEICNQRKSNTFDIRNQIHNSAPLPLLNDEVSIDSFCDRYNLDPSRADFDDLEIGLKKLKTVESPKLLNPYVDSVGRFFEWHFDAALKETEIRITPGLNQIETENANYTISLLDLNRVPLKRRRYRELSKLLATINLGADNASIRMLYLENECEFLGMNIFICKHQGIL